MKTTELILEVPKLDVLPEYICLLAVNLEIGYKGEKGDPGRDADIEGANLAIKNANEAAHNVSKELEKIRKLLKVLLWDNDLTLSLEDDIN